MSSIMDDRPSQQFSRHIDEQSTPTQHHRGGDTYNISGYASVHLGDNHMGQDTSKVLLDQLVSRLSYPQMTARSHQITQAFPATFDWMLQEQDFDNPKIDCFISWLSDDSDANGIYWVNGKPGSGKSTMTKFLDSRFRLGKLVVSRDMPVVRAQYFFWSGGNSLERCLEGMCRSLIIQILQQQPGFLDMANHALADLELSPARVQWNSAPLSEILLEMCLYAGETSKILLLIDGLDECMAQEEEQSRLVELVLRFSELHNVKVIVASRPENIFHDAFQDFPQVRMESLTHADITHYVNSRLRNQRRWKQLEQENLDSTQSLLSQIITSANGVFLWVVLVVRDLVQDFRNGDDLSQIHRKLDNIPLDLEAYFRRIVESIEPLHRAEASKMLQLTAFQENSFLNTLDFRLVDVFFTNEAADVFAYEGSAASRYFEIGNQTAFQAKVAGLLRRLRSRCKGLLECIISEASPCDGMTFTSATQTASDYNSWLTLLFNASITYLHRSFRDFLLLPGSQSLIKSFTDGTTLDCRGFFINARALQISAIWRFNDTREHATCLASHVMTALAFYGNLRKMDPVLRLLEEPISKLASVSTSGSGWFINSSFDSWAFEKSTFLSLAIDFGLIDYVSRYLSREAIATKSGRPLLDYILRPRFQIGHSERGPAYKFPSSRLVDQTLKNGADPNQLFTALGPSVWAAFLWTIKHRKWHDRATLTWYDEQYTLLEIVNKLLDAGASPFVQKRWLDQLRNSKRIWKYHSYQTSQQTTKDATGARLVRIEWVSVLELMTDILSGSAKSELIAKVQSMQRPWLEKNLIDPKQIVSAEFTSTIRSNADQRLSPFPRSREL